MTDQARVWWTRVALLIGLGWFTTHLTLHQSTGQVALVLGRYSTHYFVLLSLSVAASVAGTVFALGPKLRRVVLADRFRQKMMAFAVWLPAGLAIYVLGYELASVLLKPLWNTAFAGLFGAATLAMLLTTLGALRTAVRRPEFWMAVVGVVVALGLVEGGMRYWIRNLESDSSKRRLYDPALVNRLVLNKIPHHYELYVLRPNWTSPDGLDRTNSFGYRGEEIEVPKPDGVYRIVALGGSTTYGSAVDDWRDAYPAQLERVLRKEYGYTNVEVINGGVPGHNSWETLINLQFRALDLEPDLVILYQNTNDVHARIVPPSTYRGDNSGYRKVWDTKAVELSASWQMRLPSVLWRFLAINFDWLEANPVYLDLAVSRPCTGDRAKKSCLGITPAEALKANPPIYYERNVRDIVAVARANGDEVLLLTWAYNPDIDPTRNYAARPEYQAAFEEHNDIIRRLSNELDTYFYDFAPEMPQDAEYWADGRHMTAEGNRVRAELIAAYIDEAGIIPKP